MIKLTKYDVIIIGAGPAGLFAAIALGSKHKKVLVLEKNKTPGKKLLLSGAGQCNITQDGDMAHYAHHYGDQYKYIKKALHNFTNSDTIKFFQDRGLGMESQDNGKVFPKTRSARDVLDLLLEECANANVTIAYDEAVSNISLGSQVYRVEASTQAYHAKFVVVATGGMSYPQTGSTGDGYKMALGLGHPIVKPLPALTPVEIEDYPFRSLAGVSLKDLNLTIWRDGKKIKACKGDILFTHKGLSGPGILNHSRWMRNNDVLCLNFIKKTNVKEFHKTLLTQIDNNGRDMIKTVLRRQAIPKSLLDAILSHINIPEETQCAQINKESRSLIVKSLTEFPLKIAKMGGYHIAMVTAGGVDMKQVNPTTMESRLSKNLYFIGEVLDIDGDTGGYNIQAALSTAKLCANGINRKGKQ